MKKSQQIREKIIEIAQEMFSKFGYNETSMEEIAKKLKKGKSTLYYYFKSKEELISQVVEKEANQITTELQKVVNMNGSIEQIIKKYASRRFELLHNLINFYNAVKNQYLEYFPFVQNLRRKYDEFEFLMIKQILLKGLVNNQLRIESNKIDDVALGIVLSIKGLEIPMFSDNNLDIEKKIDILVDIFLYGLLKK